MTWRSRFPGGFCKLRGSGYFLRRGRSTPRPSGVPLLIEARISLPRLRIAANATPPAICSALCDRVCGWPGTAGGPDGQLVPNITPDPGTGIGKWEKEDVVELLRTGTTPEQGKVKGAMRETLQDGLKYLSDFDLDAIADYLFASTRFARSASWLGRARQSLPAHLAAMAR
jgi:hypothetical protein